MTITQWRKSSHSFSNGNCVEAAAWRKSSRSEAGNCVEAGSCSHGMAVRDSKDPGAPVLAFPAVAWRRFTMRAKDATGSHLPPSACVTARGVPTVRHGNIRR